jgi:hypothetical protein
MSASSALSRQLKIAEYYCFEGHANSSLVVMGSEEPKTAFGSAIPLVTVNPLWVARVAL